MLIHTCVLGHFNWLSNRKPFMFYFKGLKFFFLFREIQCRLGNQTPCCVWLLAPGFVLWPQRGMQDEIVHKWALYQQNLGLSRRHRLTMFSRLAFQNTKVKQYQSLANLNCFFKFKVYYNLTWAGLKFMALFLSQPSRCSDYSYDAQL